MEDPCAEKRFRRVRRVRRRDREVQLEYAGLVGCGLWAREQDVELGEVRAGVDFRVEEIVGGQWRVV